MHDDDYLFGALGQCVNEFIGYPGGQNDRQPAVYSDAFQVLDAVQLPNKPSESRIA